MIFRKKSLVVAIGLVIGGQAIAASAVNAAEQMVTEEIIVTARKQEESLMEIPVSVSVVDSQLIQDANLTSINDLVNTTPGLKFNSAFGRQADRPVVRGISAIQTNNELAGIFVDGIYVAGSLQTFDLDSVERVEVLKGPQSAVFGRRTFSGAINYVTSTPTPELSGKVKATLGSNGYQVLSGSVSDTVGMFGYRLNVRDYSYDGDFTNTLAGGPDVGGEESTSVNASFVFDFTEDTSLTFNIASSDNEDEHYAIQLQPASENNCTFGGTQYYCGEVSTDTPIEIGGYLPASDYGTDSKVNRANIRIDHDFGAVNISWTSAFNKSEETSVQDVTASGLQTVFRFPSAALPFPGFESANGWHITVDKEIEDSSHELWVSGDLGDNVDWRVGLYNYSEDQSKNTYNADGLINTRNGFVDTTVDNSAVMFGVDYDVASDVTLGLEMRYAEDELTTEIYDGSTVRKFDNTSDSATHRLSASWNVSDMTMVYGSWSTGVLPADFNTAAALPEQFRDIDEQELEQFEIGVKSDISDTVSVTAAIYMMEWKDQVRSEFYQPLAGSPVGYAANQGTSDINGVEADISWAATETLNLKAGFSYNDTEVNDFVSADPTDVAITGDGDLSGAQMPLSAEWDAYASAAHSVVIGDGFMLNSRLDISYQDSRYLRLVNLAETGSATLVNVGISLEKNGWRIGLWGKNLTDEDSAVSALRFVEADSFFFSGRAFIVTPRPGTEWGVTASYEF
jgi:outer membrane receptor protein involved in Fe transport